MHNADQNIFSVHIEYKETIPLLEFTNLLEGLNNQYYNHVSKISDEDKNDALLIKEINPGSIDIHFISAMLPLISDINNITTFFSSIKMLLDWLSSLKGKKPVYTSEDIKDILKIVKPVNSADRKLTISTNGDNSPVFVVDKVFADKVFINAPAALDQIKEIEKAPQEDTLEKRNAVLRFKQVEDEEKNNKNTKGIIDEIDSKPYPIMFAEGLKNPIIHGEPNPLRKNYLVDIKIQKIDDKIKSYTVLKISDSYIEENSLFTDTDGNV
jgi:hypothetical protein